MPETSKRSLSEYFRYNATAIDIDLAEAERRYDGWLDRRIRSNERLITGAAAANAVSATALFTALQSGQAALSNLGITLESAAASLGCFAMGVIAAGLAIWVESVIIPRLAAEQYERLVALRQQKATLEVEMTTRSVDQLNRGLEKITSLPPADFRFSKTMMILTNASGACWLTGVGYAAWPLWKKMAAMPLWWQ